MYGTLSALTMDLVIAAALAGVVFVGLRIAQSIFGTGSKRAAATEIGAKLVAYPTGSSAVLRRRFVRALTSQFVIMPSGERLAYAELTVRVAPEDLERLDPDGDLGRLGDDAAKLYLAHARREGWEVSDGMAVLVEVDPSLRSGWVPPARGTARTDPAVRRRREEGSRAGEPRRVGWDAVSPAAPTSAAGTMTFPALVPDLDDSPTVNVTGELRLQRGDDVAIVPRTTTTVLGRLADSLLTFAEPEVSFRHAAVRLQAGQWQLKDLGSTNGTTVDGVRLAKDVWTPLRSGSSIALAGVPVVAVMDTFGTVHVASIVTGR